MIARNHSISRRQFLGHAAMTTGLALAGGVTVSRPNCGRADEVAPSERLVLGMVGTGGMGSHHLEWLTQQPDLEIAALCDVDGGHLTQAADLVAARTGKRGTKVFRDFRELLADDGLDAVFVTTPDHWHALVAVAAARAGKDVYCEKPLANSIGEGRALCHAVHESGRVLQCGSHERSNPKVRYAAELVRNGRIGQVHTIRIFLPCDEQHHNEARTRQHAPVLADVPPEFDYDTWLGHTPALPYAEHRCHFWWRFNTRYGGGELTDRGAHIIDLAQLALNTDDTGPVELSAEGTALQGGLYDAFLDFKFDAKYANGVRLIGESAGTRGLKIEGSDGSIFIHIHGGELEAEPASLLDETLGDDELHLGRTSDHRRNFFDCVRSRQSPFATAEIGHRTATICHLCNIALKLGRPLRWDPDDERVVDDAEANALLTPTMRAPWQL